MKKITLILLSSLLVACGGGGSGKNNNHQENSTEQEIPQAQKNIAGIYEIKNYSDPVFAVGKYHYSNDDSKRMLVITKDNDIYISSMEMLNHGLIEQGYGVNTHKAIVDIYKPHTPSISQYDFETTDRNEASGRTSLNFNYDGQKILSDMSFNSYPTQKFSAERKNGSVNDIRSLAGNYVGYFPYPDPNNIYPSYYLTLTADDSMSIDEDGYVNGSDSKYGCAYDGQIESYDSDTSIFKVNFTFCNDTYSGVAISYVGEGDLIYFDTFLLRDDKEYMMHRHYTLN